MRIFLIILAGLFSLEKVSAYESRNPVYDDAFVWHLATGLSQKLIDFQVRNVIILSKKEIYEFKSDYEILFHNYLLRCDGPLPRLEFLVDSVNFENDSSGNVDNSEAYGAAITTKAWVELDKWSREILVPFMNTFSSMKYGFFPDCIVPDFLAKKNIPGVSSK